MLLSRLWAAALVTTISTLASASSRFCKDSFCLSIDIPPSTATSKKGDVFFTVTFPEDSHEWVAFAQGSRMVGSNMFIVHKDESGHNATISTRRATGHKPPAHVDDVQFSRVAGSAVRNGQVVARVKCSNCQSWEDQTMDFSSTGGDFVYALGPVRPTISSDEPNHAIQKHVFTDHIRLSFNDAAESAKSGDRSGQRRPRRSDQLECRARPSTKTASASPGATTATGPSPNLAPVPTGPFSSPGNGRNPWSSKFPKERAREPRKSEKELPYCDELPDGGSSSSSSSRSSHTHDHGSVKYKTLMKILRAHAVLGCLAFAFLLPLGGIVLRLGNFKGFIRVHVGIQVLAWAMMLAAFGMGLYMARTLHLMREAHPIMGIVTVAVLVLQPVFGVWQHYGFLRFFERTLPSHIHIWLGRVGITLGIVTGGLGFKLVGDSRAGMIAYGVVGGLMWVVYVLSAAWTERRRMQTMFERVVPVQGYY